MANDEEAESEVGVEEEEEEEEEKWVKHYSSFHQILLVGDGDFSFSLSLAQSFGSASNILASSLDSYDVVIKKYKAAKSNLENLKKLGASLLHEVDATKMKFHTDLKMRKFDRIIYNFPHAGFFGKEDNAHLIKMHRDLVDGFFRNARGMLRASGEIHVNHKTTAPFCQWNIEELALQNSLILAECVDFKIEDYPGYKNKRGDGSRCDEPFPLGECSTFKFRLSHKTKRSLRDIRHLAPASHLTNMEQVSEGVWLPLATRRVTPLAPAEHGISQQFLEIPFQMQQRSTSNDLNYPRAGHLTNMEQVPEDVHLPFTPHLAPAAHGISQQFLETPFRMQQRSTSNDFNYPRAGHLTNMGHVSEDVHLPFTQHLAPAAHGRSQQFLETPFRMQQRSTSNDFNYPRAGHLTNMGHVLEDVHLPFTQHLAPAAHGRSQQFLETSFQMQQRSTSNDFNYPRAGHLTNMGHVSEDVHLPFTQHLTPAAHGRPQQFLETPFRMQQRSTSNDFNYPRAGHLTNMGHVSEDVHLPFTQHLTPAAHGRSQQFLETPFQMQQFSPSSNFSHPRAGHSMKERVSDDVRLPLTIAARNERFAMIDGHLNNQTEIFGRNVIDSSYIHAPRFHFRCSAEMPGRTLNGDTYVLRELQRRNAILRSMQLARLMLDQG